MPPSTAARPSASWRFECDDWRINLDDFFAKKPADKWKSDEAVAETHPGPPLLPAAGRMLSRSAAAWSKWPVRPPKLTAVQGEKIMVRFFLRNGSAHTLSPAKNFFISFHAYDVSGRLLAYDNPRFALPQPVWPGGNAAFTVPGLFQPGRRGPASSNGNWSRKASSGAGTSNGAPFFQNVRLRPLVSAAYHEAWLPTFYASGRDWLDREQYLLRQTLKNNEAWRSENFSASAPGAIIRRSGSAIRPR